MQRWRMTKLVHTHTPMAMRITPAYIREGKVKRNERQSAYAGLPGVKLGEVEFELVAIIFDIIACLRVILVLDFANSKRRVWGKSGSNLRPCNSAFAFSADSRERKVQNATGCTGMKNKNRTEYRSHLDKT